jgi:hypoxanthine phosphoribosyltransferase
MTARPPAEHAADPARIVVPPTGLSHVQDRNDLAWIRTHGGGQYFILISSTHIQRRIAELAREIIGETRKKNSHVINLLIVLKGAFFFGCQLAREIYYAGGPDIIINFARASSYGRARRSSGRCRITGSLNMLKGKDVIVVEDICDTGLTLATIRQRLLGKEQAASVKTCVLLDKPAHRLARLKKTSNDFIGFQIPDVFVAGFGLEYAEKYRELPFIIAVQDRLIE